MKVPQMYLSRREDRAVRNPGYTRRNGQSGWRPCSESFLARKAPQNTACASNSKSARTSGGFRRRRPVLGLSWCTPRWHLSRDRSFPGPGVPKGRWGGHLPAVLAPPQGTVVLLSGRGSPRGTLAATPRGRVPEACASVGPPSEGHTLPRLCLSEVLGLSPTPQPPALRCLSLRCLSLRGLSLRCLSEACVSEASL